MPISVLERLRAGLEPKNQNHRQWQCLHWLGSFPAVQTKERVLHWSQHLRGSRIVPYTFGGTSDIIGRALAQKLTAVLGQNVILDNRPGGGGDVGAEIVAKHRW